MRHGVSLERTSWNGQSAESVRPVIITELDMIAFLRLLWPLLNRKAQRRAILGEFFGIGLALFEAAALVLLVPVLALLSKSTTGSSLLSRLEQILGTTNRQILTLVLGGAVCALFILKNLLSISFLTWRVRLIVESESQLVETVFAAYLSAPYEFHLAHNSVELGRTMNVSLRRTFEEALLALAGGTADAILIIGIAVVLLLVSPFTTALAVLYGLLIVVVYQVGISRRVEQAGAAFSRDIMRSYLTIQHGLSAIKEVQVTGSQPYFESQMHEVRADLNHPLRTILLFTFLPRYILEGMLFLGIAALGGVVIVDLGTDKALPVLGLYVAAAFRALPSLNRIMAAMNSCRSVVTGLKEARAELGEALTSPGHSVDVTPAGIPHHLELRSVTFSYEPQAFLLRDVSLRVEEGESIGIVGLSGAGKTTLVDIILGLLDPSDGEVVIDGHPLASVRTWWQAHLAYVPQEITLLDANLRTNVAFGVPESSIDDEVLDRVIEEAQLADLVESLPAGMYTMIGENGVRLSGGQRQRLAIARALYRRPTLLVLDEATSSLDAHTEAKLTSTMSALHGRLTMITVAHRLSTLQSCDRLYFLEQGSLVGSGTFRALADTVPAFARLVELSRLTEHTDTQTS